MQTNIRKDHMILKTSLQPEKIQYNCKNKKKWTD